MKIIYFKAINFAGIYAGTGRTEIEIDFEGKSVNDLIMLLGSNGSGKSSLLSIMNPFRETFDCRKNIITPEKEGYKEVHLKDGNSKYVVKHFYGPNSNKNKSYVSKDGVELNENGNIRTFNEILEDKFNLTKEYFTVGKIGSNVEGFIGQSTANRKSYINKFIPNIDEYLEAFDIVNDKYKDCNKDIKSLKSSLSKMDEDNLILSKTDLSTKLKLDKEHLKKMEKAKNINELKITELKDKLKDIPENLEELYNITKDEFTKEKNTLNAYISKFPKLSGYTAEMLKDKITENKSEVSRLEDRITENKKNIERLNLENESIKSNIVKYENLKNESLTDFIEPSKIRVELFNNNNSLTKEKSDLENVESSVDVEVLDLIKSMDYISIKNEVDNFISAINNIKVTYSLDIVDNTNIFKKMEYVKEISTLQSESDNIEKELTELKNKIFYLENNYDKYIDIYNKKPENCNNSNCSFIKGSLNFLNNEYPMLESLINSELENSNRLNEVLTRMSILEETISYIKDIERYIMECEEKYPFLINIISFKEINIYMKETGALQDKLQEILNVSTNYHRLTTNMQNITNTISRNESLLKVNEQKESLINSYVEIIDADKSKIENNEVEISNHNLNITSLESNIKVKENSNKLFDVYSNLQDKFDISKEKYNEYFDLYNSNLGDLETLDNLETKLNATLNEIDDTISDIEALDKRIEKINNELFLFKTYSDKLAEIENTIQDIELIKDALDPKKGIPLIFMTNYLNIISATANELLDKAYDGDFKIAFKVTAKEFLINVYKSDGTMLNDISEASQGEVAMTTVSLSLAMIENLLKDCKYNILYLDEVDATLSTQNRRIFLELLKLQMGKNIEQCFVISHNDEFYSQALDLILFKNNGIDKEDTDLMDNKSILWEV